MRGRSKSTNSTSAKLMLAHELILLAARDDPSLQLRIEVGDGAARFWDRTGAEPMQLSLRFIGGEEAAVDTVRALFRNSTKEVPSPVKAAIQRVMPEAPRLERHEQQLPLPAIPVQPRDQTGHTAAPVVEHISGNISEIDVKNRSLTVTQRGGQKFTVCVEGGFDFFALGRLENTPVRHCSNGPRSSRYLVTRADLERTYPQLTPLTALVRDK